MRVWFMRREASDLYATDRAKTRAELARARTEDGGRRMARTRRAMASRWFLSTVNLRLSTLSPAAAVEAGTGRKAAGASGKNAFPPSPVARDNPASSRAARPAASGPAPFRKVLSIHRSCPMTLGFGFWTLDSIHADGKRAWCKR